LISLKGAEMRAKKMKREGKGTFSPEMGDRFISRKLGKLEQEGKPMQGSRYQRQWGIATVCTKKIKTCCPI